MEWEQLLCQDRIMNYKKNHPSSDLRSEFEKDYHRIIGSASFRRLQDKTQVFPLDKSDFVRTRLTHSLEVSSFCKSLGQNISRKILQEIQDETFLPGYEDDVCNILQCAGLLHDIGNPPFGHFGETVIRNWFKNNIPNLKIKKKLFDKNATEDDYCTVDEVLTPQMKADFYNFEGNTQALRVVSKLHYLVNEHGMNLTKGLLATIIKYPVSSLEIEKKSDNICKHKMGFYYADKEIFDDIQNSLGLNGARHPLTYVLEAADDIAYRTADIEDAFKKGMINYNTIITELENYMEKEVPVEFADDFGNIIESLKYRYYKAPERGFEDAETYAIQNWIVTAQGKLIADATANFQEHYSEIMDGCYNKELLEGTMGKYLVEALGNIAIKYAFRSSQIMKIEIAANKILSSHLDTFIPAVLYYDTEFEQDAISDKLMTFVSDNYKAIYHIYSKDKSEEEKLYLRLLLVTDFVCGMTDSYAKRLYQEMNGDI
ncbi:MAG: deoxyguanosinetriphosphate triphosphohydrolase [Butyrivibrio sp.]|nr:deoxyguanosinetriphosphate triphosphohydrolase [Butyrivibrio sp.]